MTELRRFTVEERPYLEISPLKPQPRLSLSKILNPSETVQQTPFQQLFQSLEKWLQKLEICQDLNAKDLQMETHSLSSCSDLTFTR